MNNIVIGIIVSAVLCLIFFIAAARSFKYDIEMIKDHSTTYRLTPHWTKNTEVSKFKLLMRLMFTHLRIKQFRNWSPVRSRQGLGGVVLWKKIKKGEKTIDLIDIVFDSFDEVKIRRSLGGFITDLFMCNPEYSITIYTQEEHKIQLIIDSLRFVEHTRCNLIPIFDGNKGVSIKKYLLYKEI